MRILIITAGTGSYYCGSCMRDNTLARALTAAGHAPTLLPLYMPSKTDETDLSVGRVFYGGVNAYLQQKSRLFHHAPLSLQRLLDSPRLLRGFGRLAGSVDPAELGAMTLSVLQGENGRQRTELRKLLDWLRRQPRPDVVMISNALLLGPARSIKRALDAPLVCTLQGEDYFLDGLPQPWRRRAWAELRERARDVDLFLPVSDYYGRRMRERLALAPERVRVVLNGIDLAGYEKEENEPDERERELTVGYFARIAPEKGLGTLIDAFQLLRARWRGPELRLRVAGDVAPQDAAFARQVRQHVRASGLAHAVEFVECPDRADKIAFLLKLKVLSVPATYGESFGLYVLEALAAGTPVVQPDHAAFPEILHATGGGLLVKPDDPAALADGLEQVLTADADTYAAWQTRGRRAVRERFSMQRMARDFLAACATVVEPKEP